MARGEVCEPNVGEPGGRNGGTVFIDVDRGDAGANGFEGTPRAGIARVLHAHAVTGVQKEMRGEVERLLRAGHDRDLFRHALHAARCHQVLGHRALKWPVSHRLGAE